MAVFKTKGIALALYTTVGTDVDSSQKIPHRTLQMDPRPLWSPPTQRLLHYFFDCGRLDRRADGRADGRTRAGTDARVDRIAIGWMGEQKKKVGVYMLIRRMHHLRFTWRMLYSNQLELPIRMCQDR